MTRAVQGAAVLACLAEAGSSAPDYDSLWNDFKNRYDKNSNDLQLEPLRFATFKENVDYIYETNAKHLSFTLGVTEFADMTNEEFKAVYMGYKKPANTWAELQHVGTHKYSGEELADAVDWVAKGAVTQVKNQGQCGSCWSFSTTGAIEGAWQVATGKLVPLSEQEFVDCDQGDSGCHGGLMDRGFTFAEQNALCTESSYPYKAAQGTCMKSSCTVGIPEGGVTGYMDVGANDMQAMMSAVSKNPVSIAIEADKRAFQLYHGGVLSDDCGTQLDHGVLLVGYGTDGGKDYWKVKNSWGPGWGASGYIRFLRGAGGSGECGLLKQGSYPVVKGSVPPAPPGPPVPPTPPAPPSGGDHYKKPPCQSGEQIVEIQGVSGWWCSPSCSDGTSCPSDVPSGVTAKPGCIFKIHCALECNPGAGSNECGEAICQAVDQFVSDTGGLCTYPHAATNQSEIIV